LGETVVYGITGVASTLASVFLVPFYTRILSPDAYGVSSLLGILFSVILVVANLGMGTAIFRSYFSAKKSQRKEVAGTAFIAQTLFPLVIAILSWLLSGSISTLLFGTPEYSFLVVLSSIALFFNAGLAVPLALLRAEGRPSNYVTINFAKLIATIVFSIFLVVVLRLGLAGIFWANLIGAVLGYLIGLFYSFKRISFSFSSYWLRDMLKFGLPLVPAGLAVWILNSSDRYFLNYFAGTAEVGIYNVGYRVGNLITLVTGALQLAAPRLIFSVYEERPKDAKYYFQKINTYFYLIGFAAAFLVSVFAKEAIQILTGPAFHEAYVVIPLISFSYVAYGLFLSFGVGAAVTKKTHLSALSTLMASVLNIVLNYLLISRFGMIGAAVSTFVSFVALALIQLVLAQRVYPVKYEFRRILIVLLVGSFLVYVATLIKFGLFLTLLLKILLVLVFPVILYFTGFFENREIDKLVKIWHLVLRARFKPGVILESIRQEIIT